MEGRYSLEGCERVWGHVRCQVSGVLSYCGV